MKLRPKQKQNIELMLDDVEGLVKEITNPNYDRLNLQMDEINKIKLANYTIKNNNTIKELNHNLTIHLDSF